MYVYFTVDNVVKTTATVEGSEGYIHALIYVNININMLCLNFSIG
jgi:hypothetical protein